MFAESNGLRYIETSAKSGQNVEESFLIIARDIHKLLQDGRLNVEEGGDGVKHGFSRPPKEPSANMFPSLVVTCRSSSRSDL
jgi:GTPase SAR1 family protein